MARVMGIRCFPLLVLFFASGTSYHIDLHRQPARAGREPSLSRRQLSKVLLTQVVGSAVGAAVVAPGASHAIDVSGLKVEGGGDGGGVDLNGVKQEVTRSVFIGQWSDPNHPNGGRSISLSDTQLMGFQLAVVQLYNEAGQAPTALNALVGKVASKQTITIDFTPVGGPAEFRGVFFPATGGLYPEDRIEFPDGNAWTRRK